MLEAGDRVTRSNAAIALGAVGDPAAIPHLLAALDRETGELLWTHACRDNLDSAPVIAGGRVVLGSDDGRLYAVDLSSGKLVWEYSLGGPITGSAAVSGGRVFIGCEDGTLYAFGPGR